MFSTQSYLVRIAVVILLGAITVTAFRFTTSVNSVTEGGVIMELPATIAQFSGKEQAVSEGEKYVLPKDTVIVKKTYTDPKGDILNAQIVLAGAEKRSIHRPELCLPAQGWAINRRQTIPVTLSNGRSIT
ncbi:MAG: exosortase-associated EpsI family protein, partial [bacterium]